jgi:gliding motility-associated-like protein
MTDRSTLHSLLLFSLALFPLGLLAQLPPLQPEQDCINALPVCQNIFTQTNSYIGEGVNPNEINPGPSCLNSGERNDVWYIFTVQTPGTVCFSITPNSAFDDYDWAVYNLTNNNCSDIFSTPGLEVSCNYAPNVGCGGITGPTGNTTGPCAGQNNPCINVQAGQTFVLNVSNFSSSNSGYTLNFSNSTAVIFDNTPPQLDTFQIACNGQSVSLEFSENVRCNTVNTNDFFFTDLNGVIYSPSSVTGAACTAGGTFENDFQLTFAPALPPGPYVFSFTGAVLDNCNNAAPPRSDTVFVGLPPIPVSVSDDTLCQGQSLTLSTPALPGFTYLWSNGATTPSLTASPAATALFSITATASNGCTSLGSALIEVIPTASAQLLVSAPQVCPGDTLLLQYQGDALPVATYAWNFGGATPLSGSGPGPYQVLMPAAGAYPFSVSASQYGCPGDTATGAGLVAPTPTASFSAPQALCRFDTVQLQYTGTASVSANFQWSLGGGTPLAAPGGLPFAATWSDPGARQVCLTVEEFGCVSQQLCQPLTVNALPQVQIDSIPGQCLLGNRFLFSYAGSQNILAYDWALGEPGAFSGIASPAYTYVSAGPKTIVLQLTDVNGCVSLDTAFTEVYPPAEARFDYGAVCFGQLTPFFDVSLPDPSEPVVAWNWQFGDAAASSDSAPRHLYGGFGFYTASLEITTFHGCKDTFVRQVEVFDQPIARFAYDPACEYDAVQFRDSSQFFEAVSYAWDFGDNSSGSGASPAHLYNAPGVYPITLVVDNDKGCRDTARGSVEVYPRPVADFTAEGACLSEFALFRSSSSVPEPGRLLSYQWQFGDGGRSDAQEASRRYAAPGIYQVSLRVITQHGCRDSITRPQAIFPLPQPDFSWQDVCQTEDARFTNLSRIDSSITADSIVSWRWDFGDGQVAGAFTPVSHRYGAAGFYWVTLSAVSDKGCEATAAKQIEIWPIPAISAIEGDTVCFGSQAFLLALAGPPARELRWFYEANDSLPFYRGFSYATPALAYPQTYYVEPISDRGCLGERREVGAYVFGSEQGQILSSASVVEIPDGAVQFSLAGMPGTAEYRWDFGDGSNSRLPAPEHRYSRPGKYLVSLTAISGEGCSSRLETVIEVRQLITLLVPSGFTPNGDNNNDEFFIGYQQLESFDILIFDRYGQVVFRSNDPSFRWDGSGRNGGPLPEGVYTYRILATDAAGKKLTLPGTITLLR